jgi:hypothetical protein
VHGQERDRCPVDPKKADLNGASLIRTRLREANLRRADLEDAAPDGAELRDAELTGADPPDSKLAGVWWSHTTCPDGTDSEASLIERQEVDRIKVLQGPGGRLPNSVPER